MAVTLSVSIIFKMEFNIAAHSVARKTKMALFFGKMIMMETDILKFMVEV